MERQISSRAVAAIALVASVAIAFAVRVLPAFSVVFAHGIVNFQEPDAWFHVRTVHNLLAHFPHRSGFDPYVLFPGGQEVPTAPVWDYLLAWSAWILGWGAPSPELIDRVAAWIPAILGALFPIPAFFLARRLFGSAAAVFAALWMAAGFGTFLWITHLGLADHHVAEGLFAFLVLTWMCMAIDQRSARFAWLSGIALGLFLATRPAGIFVPATLACLVVLEPTASAMVLRAVLAGAVVFLPASESLWREYTWLSLAAAGGLAAAVLALDALARRQGWPPWVKRSIPFAAMALAAAAAMLAMPHLLGSLWYQIRRVAGAEEASRIVSTVQELQPVYRSGPGGIWSSIFHSVGISWIPALPVLVWLVLLWPARTALRLLVLWSVVMGLATIMQVRMAVYWLPVATVPAGAACAWLIHANRATRRRMVAAALGVAVLALNLPWAIELMRNDQGMSQDWLSAFTWLRENSPEPLDAGVWSGYYPHLKAGESHPSGAWGVAIWWDRGYALEELAHRIPMSNGTQSGADDMARFYTETIPEAAVGWLRRSGARYVVVDPQEPLFSGENHSRFPVQIRMLGRNQDSYVQYLAEQTSEGGFKTRPIYLPTYYQTMAARLYLSDGAAVDGTGPWVFETQPTSAPNGRTMELIVAAHRFNTEAEASAYLSRPHSARVTVGCLNPGKSCIALPAVKGIRRVFSSDPLPLSPKRAVRAVKIFEVMPEE